MEERRLKGLHVGCGIAAWPEFLPAVDEVRLDINPDTNPDVVASMTDLGDIGSFDIVYSSHSLEHLSPKDVGKALSEMRRVLKDGGVACVFVPDLEDVKPTRDVLYESEAGPVTGLDMYYGYERYARTNPNMAHRTGFVRQTLKDAIERAGFSKAFSERMKVHNLMGVGVK